MKDFLRDDLKEIPSKQQGGGQICPAEIRMIISLELNVGFTSNQAVNLSLSAVKRFIKENLSIWSVDGLWRALFHKGPLESASQGPFI